MNNQEEKYICSYCQCEFDSFNKNIVLCDKCGAPYHKDCWEENGKCSTVSCGCATCHNVIGSKKAEIKTVEKIKIVNNPVIINPPVKTTYTHPLSIIILSAILIIILGLGCFFCLAFQKDKIQAKITVPAEKISVEMTEIEKQFSWNIEGFQGDDGIKIKNNNPELFDITENSKRNLIISPKKTGEGSFTISVRNNHLRVANNNKKIKVNIVDSTMPQIIILNNNLTFRCFETGTIDVSIDKGSFSTDDSYGPFAEVLSGENNIQIIETTIVLADHIAKKIMYKIKPVKPGKVKLNLNAYAINNTKTIPINKEIEIEITE